MSNGSNHFSPLSPPSPHHHSKSRKLLLYYGIAVLVTTAIILTIYNIMVLRWCANTRRHMVTTNSEPSSTNPDYDDPNSQIALSSKYKKGRGHGHECAVCLSHFEEGEEVRQLQKCEHLFHTNCIDTWIFNSHLDCPVCRAPVRSPVMWHHTAPDELENSREVLLLGSATV